MHYLNDQGFILRRVNFGDSDRYITIFSRNHGKIEVIAKGVRKITSRRASSVELLNLVNFASVKTNKNYILTEVKLQNTFAELKCDLSNMEKVFTTCELINAIMPLGAPHIEVFDLMGRALSQMRDEKTLVYFQVRLLSILGYWDGKVHFRSPDHVKRQVEVILERKLKTPLAFTI